ncbi:dienelactone hydrolase [Pontixanthobacter aestiaquae]|uniref:Dienelactone hydrolase n=1 Tax=Pontixanthobacter aestiaquae TaxID=1509367 RepID=A0A844Z9L1_9SPHN|nr:dienelactone hydrolase [Pontixanthobacter aestiaquae]MDN3644799.1 dienelactone hydrolase [Pontixanthobacter aestiaquae]MXO84194.1 dienelactone hydrolase [Pontixanthobacter aestiaquae]
MRKRNIALGIVGVLAAGAAATAYVVSPTIHAGESGETPELGRTGDYAVGTFVQDYSLPGRTQIGGMSMVAGGLNENERTLSVRFWYPAEAGNAGEIVAYDHVMEPQGQDPVEVSTKGIARAGAAALTGEKFPLVIMSHGYRGWREQFSNLGEHLASRGYVVASIDHADMPADGLASLAISFSNVLVDRTQDQRQVLTAIHEQAGAEDDASFALIDTERTGLIGYSMGGYGALATAGASYQFANDPMSNIPAEAQRKLAEVTAEAAPIDALVTFAPWGGQPDNRAWSAGALAKIEIPVLVVSGNQDDVVNFDEGVTWLFNNLTGADRHMLVFREARHNIVGNNFQTAADTGFQAIEFISEPVWRGDRLNGINQHFVTAFLDLHLKGDSDKASYLNVPTIDSNDSTWDVAFREQLNGRLAGPEQDQHWRGFQRRWALGLEMYRAEKGSGGISTNAK